ncbi:MAG: ATP-dependent exonuclease, partial [Chitinophagaceae bacterium]|nr:ATP-dependent exonuclease [Chitinophagaceae bacterium]
ELANAKSVFLERSRDLENHERQKNSDLSFEELAKQKEELQALINERSKRKIEAEIKIKNNEENTLRLQDILRDIKKQTAVVEDWAKLNELIGSADGKKFRQIAQEYTLDVLVSFANVHLDFLSKRYILERVPDSLGLQVVDRDMGDEVRTVNSLSGGESFLVSLALALGLASLSSDTMRVESLFIDEGFGSLDPVTLNMAMDALERLHNQGRKVGVISHVQEMTERIPVQIRVLSERSGKSRVEVVTQ